MPTATNTTRETCHCIECSTSHCAATISCEFSCGNDHALSAEAQADADREARRALSREWGHEVRAARDAMERGLAGCMTRAELTEFVRYGTQPARRVVVERVAGDIPVWADVDERSVA